MPSENVESRRLAWSSYWKSGALHSCVGSYADNYEGAIGAFWQQRFSRLAPDARVLDLATGNGALVRMLWERVDGKWPVHVDAVDLAEVAPAWLEPARHVGIAFHAGVRMERLPFADGRFGLVASQFGLEYARWPLALDEAARVCRRDGELAFVLHHADSIIVRMAHAELGQQRLLLGDQGLLAAAADVLPWVARARAGDPEAAGAAARAARERYNAAMEQLTRIIDAENHTSLLVEAREYIHGIAAGRFGVGAQQQRQLSDFRERLVEGQLRTCEVIDCALDGEAAAGLVDALGQRGFGRPQLMPLAQDEGVLAWSVLARGLG